MISDTLFVNSTLFGQGVDMMLYGMSTVFIFLLALVVAINVMSRLVSAFSPEALVDDPNGQVEQRVAPLTKKIIQAAIDQHRNRR